MIGEYINMGLMLLILGITFWILRSPKKGAKPSDEEENPR
jgi:cbb3-type cytochrome oxidase subunit 3